MTYQTILMAVDLEPENAGIIDYAFGLGEKLQAVVHTLHACPGGVIGNPDGSGALTGDAAKAYVRARLDTALALHRDSPSMGKFFFHTSEPVTAVIEAAESVSADLIVVGTHARSGVARVVVGSVAEGILRNARVPVLVVRSASRAALP